MPALALALTRLAASRRGNQPHASVGLREVRSGACAAGGALRALVAQRHKRNVGHVGTDLAPGRLDPLLDLEQMLIDQLRPSSRPIQLAASRRPFDIVLDRMVGAASQLPGITQRPGQVVGIQKYS